MDEFLGESRRPITSMLTLAAGSLPADKRLTRPGTAEPASHSLKILHIARAPLGGLFRHVLDLARGQAARGHHVGLIVDSLTGGARADAVLAELAPHLSLGVARVAIARHLSFGDLAAWRFVARRIATLDPDVLHGHGAKGAALARLVPRKNGAIRVYTPHGGSLVYAPGTLAGSFYRGLERLLIPRTDLFLFESSYIAGEFHRKIGAPLGLVRVVRNGVSEAEFVPVTADLDATDLVCVGELRSVKAFDVLIETLAMLKQSGRLLSATIVGDGPDRAQLAALARQFGVGEQISFAGHRPAREAFAMGRILVVPSRAESLPYIVLEAAAAGIPIIATRVGGIPEIFGDEAHHLIPADDRSALADAISGALNDPAQTQRLAKAVNARVRVEFCVNAMVDNGLAAYREALATRKVAQFT